MSTTNTDYAWYYYVKKKGARYYIGLVDENGAAATAAYDIDLYFDELPDDVTTQDSTFPLPQQFQMGFVKGVVAELMAMSGKDEFDVMLRNQYRREYEDMLKDLQHYQINEAQQPIVQRPYDLRDD